MTVLTFLLGLILLIAGAELLVKAASRLANLFGVSPLIIGLTIVAFGTSAPELAVSINAALSYQANIALGNVIGSNIFNVLFILGLSALITPLIVSQQLIRFDVPLMILLSVLVLIFSLNNIVSRVEGLILVTGLIAYLLFLFKKGLNEKQDIQEEYKEAFGQTAQKHSWVKDVFFIIVGLALLVFGSKCLVDSAITIAHYLGVSDLVIGLTIIAAGTSMPEVVTSVIASIKGERDIAVGNVIGSNLFNIMGVLGLTSLISPTGIEVSASIIHFDLPVMIAVAFACLPVFFTDGAISRKEGTFLFAYYIIYTVYLILAASHHDALPQFSNVMLYFVIPITVITLIITVYNEKHKKTV